MEFQKPATVDLEVSDEDLIRISHDGLLALNLEEMRANTNPLQGRIRESSKKKERTAS